MCSKQNLVDIFKFKKNRLFFDYLYQKVNMKQLELTK